MNTGETWSPNSLKEANEVNVLIDFESRKPIKNSNKKKYKCACGCWCWDFQMFDVRGIAGIDGTFICDGCYSKLERNLVDIDGTGKPANIQEFKQRYIKAQGASLELQNKIGKKYDANGEVI